jgi:hypothetical protein
LTALVCQPYMGCLAVSQTMFLRPAYHPAGIARLQLKRLWAPVPWMVTNRHACMCLLLTLQQPGCLGGPDPHSGPDTPGADHHRHTPARL